MPDQFATCSHLFQKPSLYIAALVLLASLFGLCCCASAAFHVHIEGPGPSRDHSNWRLRLESAVRRGFGLYRPNSRTVAFSDTAAVLLSSLWAFRTRRCARRC